MKADSKYCVSYSHYSRRKAVEVFIGEVPLGGDNPIRIQTMTTTNTNDTIATAEQCIRAYNVGSEYVRITTQSTKEAANLQNIKEELERQGITIPLIADVHFNPAAALESAKHVEKVRINPGNFVDPRAKFKMVEYSDSDYKQELARIEERLIPLLDICKKRKVAIRIGVNHGSLSDRIMSRYGDTPEGMVESAMEFLRIFRKHNFHDIVISMKSSNTRVMVQAVRLCVVAMNAEGMNYPLHLGVTEAGDGEDGRIKSAVGMGALLADGIGDTIRVSLTEEPEVEIPVARKLVSYFEGRQTNPRLDEIGSLPYNPFEYKRRVSEKVLNIGGENQPVVIANLSGLKKVTVEVLSEWGWSYNSETEEWTRNDLSADYILVEKGCDISVPKVENLPIIGSENSIAAYSVNEFLNQKEVKKGCFLKVSYNDLNSEELQGLLRSDVPVILLLQTENANGFAEQRAAFITLMNLGITRPVVICRNYADSDTELFQLKAASDVGGLQLDGLGDGVMLTAPNISRQTVCQTAFSILQASRTRISKTEYISCPGCGRTLFNLQDTLKKVKAATAHLKGLKIGVMGCVVNGPGEMADADYGYVGAGYGRVSLYKGKELVKKNIPEQDAIRELVTIIKANNDWVD
ncbi:MAG TPA: (E)-4-hydroxy-3-methylbut-2-enyl-diphosphate synthase [Tenuifilaceae bacterium]|nr:(E)-4-hydroxy-3-methylbut-2-enyl-diphosphate synthase [Tenuifilaceae bacterium]